MDKGIVSIAGLTVIVIAAIFVYASANDKKLTTGTPNDLCVQHEALDYHIHPVLSITIKDQPVPIPANIGITASCMKPIHTHDDSGTLHVEFPLARDVKLGEFFTIWGKPFSREQILDSRNGDGGTVQFLVNGQANSEYDSYIVKDHDKIEIRYE